MSKTERNFWLDMTIFVAFLLSMITGLFLWMVIPHKIDIVFLGFSRNGWITAHIISGIVGLAGIVMHIVWHWDWLKVLRGRPLGEMPDRLRVNRVVDRTIWITYIATNIFGAMAWMLPFGKDIRVLSIADRLHGVTALVWLGMMFVHLGLHRKWIYSVTRRYTPLSAVGRS